MEELLWFPTSKQHVHVHAQGEQRDRWIKGSVLINPKRTQLFETKQLTPAVVYRHRILSVDCTHSQGAHTYALLTPLISR